MGDDKRYFKYCGKSNDSKHVEGVLTAGDEQGAVLMSRAHVDVLLSLEEVSPEEAKRIKARRSGSREGSLFQKYFPYRPSLAEKAFIFFQLASMLEAGVDLIPSLEALSEEMDDNRAKIMFQDIGEKIREGADFSQALAHYPSVFPEVLINVISVGEASGQLDQVLKSISHQLDRLHEVRGNVISALAYPAVTMCVAIVVVLIMLLKVLPMFEKIYSDFGSELPLITRTMMSISHSMRDYFLVWGGVAALLVFAIYKLWQIPEWRMRMEAVVFKVPVFGPLIEEYIFVQITRTLGLLIRSGIHILNALQHTANAIPWITYQRRIMASRESVSEGKMVADLFKQNKVLPPMANRLLSVGEQTGTIDDMLEKIAIFYDRRVMNKVKMLSSLIEPLMIVFLGAVIGVLLVAMYMPIFQLGRAMKGH
jgi:type IV pilus assembly protein PilC